MEGSWVGAAVVVVWSVAAVLVFLVWVGFSWLPFLFLMRILPMSSDGLGICWPDFSWMLQVNRKTPISDKTIPVQDCNYSTTKETTFISIKQEDPSILLSCFCGKYEASASSWLA